MFRAAASQLTTPRRDFCQDLAPLSALGFEALAIWRHKLSDVGLVRARGLLAGAGLRASSMQWIGGFTGGDGRSFDESLADAAEAVEAAAAIGAPVVVVHAGCRGGHTRGHARRLLCEAIERLAPRADRAGVTLAIKPFHRLAAAGCSFLSTLVDALEIVDELVEHGPAAGCVGLAIDLWHFGDDPDLGSLLPLLIDRTAIIQVADRAGPVTPEQERLPIGRGALPLEDLAEAFLEGGYRGDFEFDPVGEAVEADGYDHVLESLARTADGWSRRVQRHAPHPAVPSAAARHRSRACAGIRRSQASSQVVSPG
jgi:sugar phosphate isomerase/epimerase